MMKLYCTILLALLSVGLFAADALAQEEPAWPLATRFRSYGDYAESAWEHMPRIGLKHTFLAIPEACEVDATIARLQEHGLTPVVIRGNAELSEESFVEDITAQLAICEKMGVKYMFLSAKRKETPMEVAYQRLRGAGDAAKKHGVIVALETHPDLGTNGDVQVETMKAVNHPNIRVNFDTANVTYYNKNTTALKELEKSIEYVATIEFKDHSEEFETWDFPVVGQGKVDFEAIVALLRKHDYAGPVTIEFEGTEGIKLNEEKTKLAIAESVAYVRSLASFK